MTMMCSRSCRNRLPTAWRGGVWVMGVWVRWAQGAHDHDVLQAPPQQVAHGLVGRGVG